MGRQIRKVPASWEHPKDENGNYIPLFKGPFSKLLSEWETGNEQWEKGLRDDYNGGWQKLEGDELNFSYEDWTSDKPVKEDYMPEWSEEEKTHIQLYENTTEGTPITPIFKDLDPLCEYAEKNCWSFADWRATKEQWIEMLQPDLIDNNSIK